MKNKFLLCGNCGLVIELVFTGLAGLRRHDYSMRGQSSIIMFPIYGAACCIAPISGILCRCPIAMRGCIYTALIYLVEYASGVFLRKRNCCPWDYSDSPANINGLIRLDYAPLWFLTGLFFEKIVS